MGKLQEKLKQAISAHQSGRLDDARRLYREVLSLNPQLPDANNLMGLLLIQSKEPVKAVRHIKRALRIDPKNAQSHFNLGIAYKDLERMSEAANAFAEAALLDTSNIEYQSSLGNALRLAGQPRQAVQVLEKALLKASGNQGVRVNLALAQNDLGAMRVREGEQGQAAQHFLRAIKLEPGHAQAHMNLGLTLEQLGELDKAAIHYQAAIKAQPGFTAAHFQLAHLRTHHSSESEISAMKHLLGSPESTEKDRVQLAFGLGQALESIGEYREAFSYMKEAHRLQSKQTPFSLAAATEQFAEIHRVFNLDRLKNPETCGPTDQRPVFIVGMPRSGTTLAEQVLSSHPGVRGTGESVALALAARSLSGEKPYPGGLENLSEDRLDAAATTYLTSLTAGSDDAIRITDTTPMNFLLVGFAAMLLPGARFVFCTRDPMDNCLSLFRQMLTGANEFTHTLEDLGGYYRLHHDLMQHWQAALGERVYQLRYESLILENEQQVRNLLEFCELPFDDRCLRFYESERVVRSPSAAQVRQPVYDTSIGAWKRYEEELAPLSKALKD